MADFPLPGQPVRGSKSGAPIMALFDLLGRRWAMGIVWVLANRGPLGFRALQAECEMSSPTMLNTRIKELVRAGLIEMTPEGYAVTKTGRELHAMLEPLGAWAKHWARDIAEEGR